MDVGCSGGHPDPLALARQQPPGGVPARCERPRHAVHDLHVRGEEALRVVHQRAPQRWRRPAVPLHDLTG
ncbi:hypothetical protein QFZ24_000173 [Streptomyces phaeochromogenes]|uniref:hypothetical protein n=1 Tax=Streptomyces phaeochromogenes TaxID=1923 RepID=UPI00278DC008|nr:hypothetical protein [Streptomyces phaeochromogenes]MDQ0946250.1 hypothetical protein [Streptomyces phaeochromogenes]